MIGTLSKPTVSEYTAGVKSLLDTLDTATVNRIIESLKVARETGATVYTAGNGGSAANASHLACHLRECGIKAVCLTDSAVSLTAMANDYYYAVALVKSLPGGRFSSSDYVVAISCSGTSPNILELLARAQQDNAVALGLFGFKLKCQAHRYCRYALVLDSTDYESIEDVHSSVIHMMRKSML